MAGVLEQGTEARRRGGQVFGQHPRLADDGHEVGVAVPARHQVHVQVIEDAGAGRTAEIDPDVDALRLVRLASATLSARCVSSAISFNSSAVSSRSRRDVAARHDHQVAVVVGIQVEDDVARAPRRGR